MEFQRREIAADSCQGVLSNSFSPRAGRVSPGGSPGAEAVFKAPVRVPSSRRTALTVRDGRTLMLTATIPGNS